MELDVYLALVNAGVDAEKAADLARALKQEIARHIAAKFDLGSKNPALYDHSYV